MPQIDVNTLHHAPGVLPEATEYVIKLIMPAINMLSEQVSELRQSVSALKEAALIATAIDPRQDFLLLVSSIEKLKAQKAGASDLTLVVSRLEDFVLRTDLVSSLTTLAEQTAAVKAAVISQSAKLDADFAQQNLAVSGATLDVNYRSSLGL